MSSGAQAGIINDKRDFLTIMIVGTVRPLW